MCNKKCAIKFLYKSSSPLFLKLTQISPGGHYKVNVDISLLMSLTTKTLGPQL